MEYYRTMQFLVTLLLSLTFWVPISHTSDECPALTSAQNRVVQILRHGRGAGSGVLIDGQYVLTAHHVLKYDSEKPIWLRTPFEPLNLIRAEIAAISHTADLALLKIIPTPQELLPLLKKLSLHTPTRHQNLYHMGYAFGQLYRFGIIPGTYQSLQQTNGQKDQAMHVSLMQPAFGGDSGGPLFTCEGKLAGIEFANRAHEGLPQEAYFVTAQSVQNLLKSIAP